MTSQATCSVEGLVPLADSNRSRTPSPAIPDWKLQMTRAWRGQHCQPAGRRQPAGDHDSSLPDRRCSWACLPSPGPPGPSISALWPHFCPAFRAPPYFIPHPDGDLGTAMVGSFCPGNAQLFLQVRGAQVTCFAQVSTQEGRKE